MKKLLSIILSIIMVASMFGIIAVPTVMASAASTDGSVLISNFDTEAEVFRFVPKDRNVSFDNGAMKIDMSVDNNAKLDNGLSFNIPMDSNMLAKLDANTLYKFSIRFRTEGITNLGAYIDANLSVNSTDLLAASGWDGKYSYLFYGSSWVSPNSTNVPTTWTEVVAPGNFQLIGNSLTLYFSVATPDKAGTVWIDDIKMVPVEIIPGGSVKATGIDENGNTIYTATANKGNKVTDITAINRASNYKTFTATVNEISRTIDEVKFTISYSEGLYLCAENSTSKLLTVNFAEASHIGENGNVILKEFGTMTADILGNGRVIDTEKAYSEGSSLKLTMPQSVSGYYGNPGMTVNIYPDMEFLNVNQKYRLRIALASDNSEVSFNAFARIYGTVNGTEVSTKWNNDRSDDYQILGRGGSTLTTEFKEFTSAQTFAPFGNNFYISLTVWATYGTEANVWIDKVELVPVEDGIDDGVVRITGKTDTGATLYTAYANEGYTVDAITARAGKNHSVDGTALNVNIVEKVSDREVSFTVDSFNLDAYSITAFDATKYYIRAIFGGKKPVLMNTTDEYIICDFSENSQQIGNATAIYEEDIETGACYATDAATTDISFFVDGNVINKFDAANDYKLSLLVQSSDDWEGKIKIWAQPMMNNKQASALADVFAGECFLFGNNETSVLPGYDFGWTKYEVPNPYVFPIAGETYKIRLLITRTSESGTLYLDNIAIRANDYVNNFVQVTDYSVQKGFVKSRYDNVNDRMIYTAVAFDGYELDNLAINIRAWGGQEVEGVQYGNEIFEMPRTFDELKSITESSFSIDTSLFNDHDNTKNLRFQTHWNMGKYCVVSFKEAVAGVAGDANDDGAVNVLDFIKVKKYLSNPATQIRIINIDVNDTETADTEDFIALKKQLLGVTA